MRRLLLAVALLSTTAALEKADAQTGQGFVNDRMYLWNTKVQGKQGCLKMPQNCTRVKPRGAEFIVTKPDKNGQYLLVPTILMSGIEAYYDQNNKQYLPNYWQDAAYYAGQLLKPQSKEWIGVAINSANTRSEDQLHFHLCELKQEAADLIDAAGKLIQQSDAWQPNTVKLLNKYNYHIRKSSNLTKYPPFQYTFDGTGTANAADRHHKAEVNLLYALDPNRQGYLLYNTDGGAAEELLASQCH
jgi:CDP-diacylglycerol pyrophosphatase